MNAVCDYARPTSLSAALALLAQSAPTARPLAGGTFVSLAGSDAAVLVDLSALGLDGVSSDTERVTIGSMTTLQSLVEAPDICPTLRHGAEREASRNIRQQATVGGCVALGFAGPLLTCLLALEAEVTLQPGNIVLPLAGYLDQRRAGDQAKSLIVSLAFSATRRLGYAEIVRTPADAPVLCVAVGAEIARDRLAQVALVCSGAGQPLAIAPRAATGLEGAALGEAAERCAGVAWEVDFIDDGRALAAYRRSMLPVLARRAIEDLAVQL
jgi:CO/xanthine dehydrogenase FAD-binding subunit